MKNNEVLWMVDDIMTGQKFNKYSKIRQLGHDDNKEIFHDAEDEIIIEEKIDGANFRFMIKLEHHPKGIGIVKESYYKNVIIVFGSRCNALGNQDTEIGGCWRKCVKYLKEKIEHNKGQIELPNGAKTAIFYGEAMMMHSIDYDWENTPPFVGFDVLVNDKFVDYNTKIGLFEQLGLATIPLLWKGKAKDAKDNLQVPKSEYYIGEAEGICIKNYSKQLMAKIVTEKFKEVNREAFGIGRRYANDDTERYVAMYCTNARVDKMIFKLLDEGEVLSKTLMTKIPRRVNKDIFEEHWEDILDSSSTINFKRFRSLVSRRCYAVLIKVMVNNALDMDK